MRCRTAITVHHLRHRTNAARLLKIIHFTLCIYKMPYMCYNKTVNKNFGGNLMSYLIQYSTLASKYDGPFGGGHPWISAGMGYLIATDEGRLIAIDGGHPADTEAFIALIEENSKDCTVDTWIITHPHIDHYSVFFNAATRYSDRVKINKVVYRFPPDFKDSEGNGIEDVVSDMEEALRVSGADHVTPTADDELYVGSSRIKFYFTPEDTSHIKGKNPLSLIFSVTVGKSRMMFTGDTWTEMLDSVLKKYGSELKSDFLQLPHHGLCDTGHDGFYKVVSPDTVLIPTSTAGYNAMNREEYAHATGDNKAVEAAASRVYKSFEGTVKIEL